MKEYRALLEETIQHDLFRGRNKVDCLDRRNQNKFKVVVDMIPVEDEAGTKIEECGAQGDDKKF